MQKLKYLFICLFTVTLITSCTKAKSDTQSEQIKTDTKQEKTNNTQIQIGVSGNAGGVSAWCNAYMNKDFNQCDVLASDSNEMLRSFYTSDEAQSSKLSTALYKLLLDKSADAIVSIESTEINDNSVTIHVTSKLYKQKSKFKLDKKACTELINEYLSTGLTDSQFTNEFSELILKNFEDSFELTDTTFSFDFEMKEEYTGELLNKASNTAEFVKELIAQQGISSINSTFEKQLPDLIKGVLPDLKSGISALTQNLDKGAKVIE